MTTRKGREALFFLLGCLIMMFGVGLGRLRVEAGSSSRRLWIFYARATSSPEILYARQFTARGIALGLPLKLGRLGLVQETQVATTGTDGQVWVTLGTEVLGIKNDKVTNRLAVPFGDQILSVRWVDQRLYGVEENVSRGRISIWRWHKAGWASVAAGLPEGITTIARGTNNSVWVLTSDPNRACLREVSGGHRVIKTPSLVPQGTVGFYTKTPILPFSRGANEFGYYTGQMHRFRSVYQAAISVMNTSPLWGLSVKGVVPFEVGGFDFSKTVPWKKSLATTPVVVGKGMPNVVILDGFSQGIWFNVRTGELGPSFQIKTPWWAVVRAAALASY